jgi:hypothetical protein
MTATQTAAKRAGSPPWHFAPHWANYLAMDASGLWVWFEYKPVKKKTHWDGRKGREDATIDYAPKKHRSKWKKSLQRVQNYGAKTGTKEVLNRHWAYMRGEINLQGNKIINGR